MKIKIYWKLTALFCAFTALILLAVYFYLAPKIESQLVTNRRESLKREIFLNKTFLERELEPRYDMSTAPLLAARIGAALAVRATIIAADGTVFGDSDLDARRLKDVENHLTRPEVQDALKYGFGQSERYSATIRKRMLYMAVAVGEAGARKPGQPLCVLRLAVPIRDIELVREGVRDTFIFAAMLVFLLAAVLSFVIAFFISKPLSEMSSVAKAMSKGDFSRKIFRRAGDEIGGLATALNQMSDEIKNKIEKLTSEEAKLEAVLSSMVEGVLVTDGRGKIILVNPSVRKLFMIDAAPEGRRPLEVIRNAGVQDVVDIVLSGGRQLTSREVTINLPEEKSLMVNGVPVMNEGVCAGAILVFHDITELKRLENVRKDFVANVSHELRTPIASIKGYAETLMGGAMEDPAYAKDFLRIIHEDSGRLAKLIDEILDLSKIESGKMNFSFRPVEIASVIKRVMSIVANQAKARSISISCNIPTGIPAVNGDEGRLAQVVLNLMDNAIKYTPEGGSVAVSASAEGKSVRVDVKDTGIGIPEKDLPRIFERFYRVDKAHSRELGGTGLGLSIAKHIVQVHKGELRVISEQGKGSTFSFTIPIA